MVEGFVEESRNGARRYKLIDSKTSGYCIATKLRHSLEGGVSRDFSNAYSAYDTKLLNSDVEDEVGLICARKSSS